VAANPSVLAALKQGFSVALGQGWITVVFWGASLLLALLAALPFRSLLVGEAGRSLMVKDLVKGFDYTFLNDFMQNYGVGFTPVLNQSLLLLALQYILLVFFVGGMVRCCGNTLPRTTAQCSGAVVPGIFGACCGFRFSFYWCICWCLLYLDLSICRLQKACPREH